ncbi:MAG: hypothetical protein ACOYU4_06495 [Thermodesulfobacteriota bacterium]
MNFGQIDQIILFGGAPLLSVFAQHLKRRGASVTVFSSKRHLQELIMQENQSLEAVLKKNNIPYYSCSDINQDPHIRPLITGRTLGIGLGEVWSFRKDLIDLFGGRLLDFMGIRLPQYRGGAHYSWQILRKNRIGCCNLQIINEDMVQGVFDSGEIVKSREYFFPVSARIPQDYFDFAVKQELAFLEEFLEEIKAGRDFPLTRVQENFSLYFPRLYTIKHAYINWDWDGPDIELFIYAFDDPYPGASTFLNGRRFFLKDCYFEPGDGPFHPFQVGLIYRIANDSIFVATKNGTLIVKKIFDENGINILSQVKLGQRLFTPMKYLEEAMTYQAVYDAEGIVE